jgi:hypothetical protein
VIYHSNTRYGPFLAPPSAGARSFSHSMSDPPVFTDWRESSRQTGSRTSGESNSRTWLEKLERDEQMHMRQSHRGTQATGG